MKLSIVIPIYNEVGHLVPFLHMLFTHKFPCEVEFIFVDDNSNDGSWDLIKRYAERPNVKCFRQPRNKGKGAALHRGFELASGDIITVRDADFEYRLSDLSLLVKPIIDGEADVVYGSRFGRGTHNVHRTYHYLINRLLTLFSNFLSGLYIYDMETCYKLFRADLIKNIKLTSQRFGFEPEVTAKIATLSVRIREYPISYYPRNHLQGKKITWKDGIAALWFIIKYNSIGYKHYVLSNLPRRYLPEKTKPLFSQKYAPMSEMVEIG